jgi:NitT/TauT family transport system substrate-binding protein
VIRRASIFLSPPLAWASSTRVIVWILLIAIGACMAVAAHASDRIRIAVQKTGTLAWELEVIKTYGLDREAGLDLAVTELAGTEAGKIALKGGSADIILSDWLFVARERGLGGALTFHPYSSTLGSVMVPGRSDIRDVADLKGKKLAIAGGPLDKSWLLLQAFARRSGLDLKTQSTLVYGAPPLLSQKALQGETDATLTFWNFCAELEAQGFRRAIPMDLVMTSLGAKQKVAIVGYVFNEPWAAANRDAIRRFFAMTDTAKQRLAESDADWQRLAPRIGARDAATLVIYRQRYRDGIPHRSVAEEYDDAKALYTVLHELGGADLTGPAKQLDPHTFYRGSLPE